MISLADRFQSRTSSIIAKAGMTVVYTKVVDGEYDPDTGVTSTQTPFTIKAFKAMATAREMLSPNLVGREVSVFLVAAKDISFKPEVGDTITYIFNLVETTARVATVMEHHAGDKISMFRVLCTYS